ncbi:MAG TPA: agmatinase [Candidatus Lokiarchaeia archaeon]
MKFFDFEENIEPDTDFVVFGIPWDYLTSINIANSAIAPQKIREVTKDIALATETGFNVLEMKVADLGDIDIEPTNVDKNIDEIINFINRFYAKNKDLIPIMIGGDHFCTYPVFKAVGDNFDKKQELGVLIFDSHLDFYEEWDKGKYSHATVSHRIFDLDYVNEKNLLIVGTRDIDILELDIAKEENIKYFMAYQFGDVGLEKYVENIVKFYKSSGIKYLYLSIDVDVLDPSIAPGTGYAIPGGFSYREMWKILREIAKQFKIIGFDLVEVAPNLDSRNRVTCNLAAKLIIELMSFILKNK